MTEADLKRLEEAATELKAAGYTSGVVARRMITEHGMEEARAVELVSRLYGKKVNPRAGDTASAVAMGAVLIAAGLIGIFVMYGVLEWQVHEYSLTLALMMLSVSGVGARQVFLALVNAGVKEDLGDG